MAGKTETINLKVNSDIGEVSKDAKGLASEFKVMGVSLNSLKAGFASVGKAAKASFATIKAGIASTGIGLLVIAVGSLLTFFTKTKRGADILEKAFSGLGAVTAVFTDRLSKVGETLTKVFSQSLFTTLKELKNSFSGITDEIKEETKAIMDLKQRTHELRDADNEFLVQKAKTRKEIEKARLIAEDETKSAEERLENLKKALDLEAETTEKELELAKERMQIHKEEMKLSENMAEDEAELARLQADIIERETTSIKMRRRVVTEVNSLEREIHTEKMARLKELKDADNERMGTLTKMPRLAGKSAQGMIKADNTYFDNYNKKSEESNTDDLEAEMFKQQAIRSTFEVAKTLGGKNANLQKGIAVAETIYSTQKSIVKALADVPYPWNLVQAVANGVMGANAIRTIMSTSPSSGGGGGGGATPTASAQPPAPQMLSGAFELGGGMEPEPARAYVVSDDITQNQNKLATIRRRATI